METIQPYLFEIVIALVYLIGFPMLIGSFTALHKYVFITRRKRKLRRNDPGDDLPDPLGPKITRKLGFTIKKDNRKFAKTPLSYRSLFIAMYTIGLFISVLGAFTDSWNVIFAGFTVFVFSFGFSLVSASRILKQRDMILKRVQRTVGVKFTYTKDDGIDLESAVQVTEWENFIEPRKINIEIPLSFNSDGQAEIMRHINQHLSKISSEAEERSWVPADDHEKGIAGWDYGSHKLSLRTVPPLPKMAKWHAEYVLDERCEWSFFPLGVGVENGVVMKDPENPEQEINVIGIDVSGKQGDLGRKLGFPVSSRVTTTPMALVAGSTGGGKSLSLDTLIPVIKITN